MTEEERNKEGADEAIEDLEAPAGSQDDVVGGRVICAKPTCPSGGPAASSVSTYCNLPTCRATKSACGEATMTILVYDH
jgi:hypothetical protein